METINVGVCRKMCGPNDRFQTPFCNCAGQCVRESVGASVGTIGSPVFDGMAVTVSVNGSIPSEPLMTVKKSDLEKWVAKMKEDNEFRNQVREDAIFVESMVATVLTEIGGIGSLEDIISNPLTSITKVMKFANKADKLGIDVERLKAIALKYRAKEVEQLQAPKKEIDGIQ